MRTQPWFRRRPRLAIFVSLATMTVLLDLLLASAVRAVGRSPFASGDRVFRVAHPTYHHGLRPNVDCVAQWGGHEYPLRTNSLGLRDAEVRVVDPRGDPRVSRLLLLGDSFTEGIGVTWEESFAGMLAQRLRTEPFDSSRGRDHDSSIRSPDLRPLPTGVELLNAGCVSYAPILYLARLRHLLEVDGLHIDRLLVLIDASDVHDEACNYSPDADGAPIGTGDRGLRAAWRRFYQERSLIAGAVATAIRWLGRDDAGSRQDWTRSLGRPRAAWSIDDAVFGEFGGLGTSRALTHMRALVMLARQHGIEVSIAVYPWPDHVMHGSAGRHVEMWQTFCAAEGLEFLDLCPLFFAAASEPAECVRELFIAGDVHFSPAGHALVARTLADWMLTSLAR